MKIKPNNWRIHNRSVNNIAFFLKKKKLFLYTLLYYYHQLYIVWFKYAAGHIWCFKFIRGDLSQSFVWTNAGNVESCACPRSDCPLKILALFCTFFFFGGILPLGEKNSGALFFPFWLLRYQHYSQWVKTIIHYNQLLFYVFY